MFLLKLYQSILLIVFVLNVINSERNPQYYPFEHKQQLNDAHQQSFPINGMPMFDSNSDNYDPSSRSLSNQQIERLIEELIDTEKEKANSDSDLFQRDKKKDKSIDSSETSPLLNHRRKTYPINNPEDTDSQACESRMTSFESNKIIDSKSSIKNGAKFLGVQKVNSKSAENSLNELKDACIKECCSSSSCDASLLSLKLGEDGYRCYLFKCAGRCIMVKHNDYIVIRSKLPEQLEQDASSNNNNQITTGQNQDKDICNREYEFTCIKSGKCIPIYDVCDSIDHCEDKSDESNCTAVSYPPQTTKKIAKSSSSSSSSSSTKRQKTKSSTKSGQKPIDYNLVPESKLAQDEDEIDELLNNVDLLENSDDTPDEQYSDDYDEYKLLKQQNSIIEHLKELEEEHLRQALRQKENEREKDKILFETPKDFLDSFMKENSQDIKPNKNSWLATSSTSTKKTTKIKLIFHDMDSETFVNSGSSKSPFPGFSLQDKIDFEDKEKSVSNITQAVVLLIFGILIVIAFFVYLLLSTKYVSKRLKWISLRGNKENNKNVDVDGDYLINGMYL